MNEPWKTELDYLDFVADGLPCVMKRNTHWGVWCGYVGIDSEHPLFGLPRNHQLKLPLAWFKGRRPLEGSSPIELFRHLYDDGNIEDACSISLAFQVHGGINYAEDHPPGIKPNKFWWFGFDCGHAGDYQPGSSELNGIMAQFLDTLPDSERGYMNNVIFQRDGAYRDQQYVVGECQSLAAQLNAIVAVIARKTIK